MLLLIMIGKKGGNWYMLKKLLIIFLILILTVPTISIGVSGDLNDYEPKLNEEDVSGFNPAVYNMVLSKELDPYKCLLKQINSERYDAIENILCA